MGDRYILTQHEEGTWNVIDTLTGGPVEIGGVLLYRLDLRHAELMKDALEAQAADLDAHLQEILRGPKR